MCAVLGDGRYFLIRDEAQCGVFIQVIGDVSSQICMILVSPFFSLWPFDEGVYFIMLFMTHGHRLKVVRLASCEQKP